MFILLFNELIIVSMDSEHVCIKTGCNKSTERCLRTSSALIDMQQYAYTGHSLLSVHLLSAEVVHLFSASGPKQPCPKVMSKPRKEKHMFKNKKIRVKRDKRELWSETALRKRVPRVRRRRRGGACGAHRLLIKMLVARMFVYIYIYIYI